jgi:diacylglycerol kinase (ATP)
VGDHRISEDAVDNEKTVRVIVSWRRDKPQMPEKGSVELPEFPMDRWLRATVNSWNGLLAAMRSEAAFRQELVALTLAVPLAFVVAPDIWKRLALIAVVLFLVVVELLNTAIEKLADHVTPALHPGIGRIKDMGSAAVGVALLLAAAIWLVAIGERLAIL